MTDQAIRCEGVEGARHTAGPWTLHETPTLLTIIGADGVRVLQTSWHSVLRNPYPLRPEAYANARLAVVAPELLAALGELEAWVTNDSDGRTQAQRQRGRKALIAARAAISKAQPLGGE